MLKKLLAATALCAAANVATAADLPSRKSASLVPVAIPTFDAFASVGVGYNWATGKPEGERDVDANGAVVEGRATFFAPIAGSLGFQADGVYERTANSIPVNGFGFQEKLDVVAHTGTVAAHIFTRNNSGLVGLFSQANVTADNVFGMSGQNRRYFLGVEGQYFMGNVTMYGQIAYQNLSYADLNLDNIEAGGTGVNVVTQLRYFASPNFMLALKGDYERLNGSDLFRNVDTTSWRLGARAEYRFDVSPVSAFADVSHRWADVSGLGFDYKETETRTMVGLKLNFGSRTLFERDRSGASLDPIQALRLTAPVAALAAF